MLIAGPNLTIDRLVGVERLDPGHVHRADCVEARVGGGGANAARVARWLGARSKLITIIPERDVVTLPTSLAEEELDVEWVTCRGEVRVATILREQGGRLSMVNEPGPALDAGEWEAFTRLVVGRLQPDAVLLCSGSLPLGAPADGYAQLARRARHAGSACVIDVAGPALAATLEVGEGVVTPNLAEAESLLFGPRAQAVQPNEDTRERAEQAATSLLHRGAFRAVVTAGKAGAAYAEQGPQGKRGWMQAPDVPTRNPIGAGDAFACGLALRLQARASVEEAVGYAVAVAAAHVESHIGHPVRERVDEMVSASVRFDDVGLADAG